MIAKFEEFESLLERIKKPKKVKPNAGVLKTKLRKDLLKRYRKIGKKWVCHVVTTVTKKQFENDYPGQPFDIRKGSHRILLNTKKQFEKAKIDYRVGNVIARGPYKGEEIVDVNFHPYNPLIDNVLFGEQK